MTRLASTSLLLALAACTTAPTDVATPTAGATAQPTAAMPALDLSLTGGLDQAAHVEVSPGVFVVRDLYESGEVGFLALSPAREAELLGAAESGTLPPPPLPTDGGIDDGDDPMDDGSEDEGSTCFEYESDNYQDSTRGGNLFGGNPSWYGVVSALSYHDTTGPRDVRSDYVSTYLYTSAPSEVDYAYAYGYVYIEGRYVGYINDYLTPGTSAVAYGTWRVSCHERESVTVDMSTYHYLYDGDQYLNVGDKVSATVACCP